MKLKDRLRELKDLNIEALKAKEKEFSEEVFWLKLKLKSGQLNNFASVKKARKDLARIKTLIRGREIQGKKGA